MLIAKCRTLEEDNEEIGNQAAEGKGVDELSRALAAMHAEMREGDKEETEMGEAWEMVCQVAEYGEIAHSKTLKVEENWQGSLSCSSSIVGQVTITFCMNW
ncbi:hypothetical protein K2173_026974 [Erythroxylum novogranatense]|uniref:Uncharacterized protein n=1 Tax=Erythroxylum novogranatense TaxID=1862640 RepID=A0AAV8TXY4_9ROSI|nr:hypothetical protein K2173_026974 [Erythroxylum novogranatense]